MELNEKDQSIISDMIYKFFQNSNSNSELEFRIGKFREGFKSHNDPEIFYKIKNVYKNYYSYEITKTSEINFIKETIINEKTHTEKIKKITNDTNTEYMVKTPLRVYNIFDYDMKLSVENEKKISEKLYEELSAEKNTTNKTKERISFILNENMRLDLTVVKIDEITEYQIELEIIKTAQYDFNMLFENIFKHLNTILQYKQKNYFIISNREKNAILTEYSQLVKSRYFVGVQPETLHFEHLNLLKKQYLLTYKADGERGLLFINKNSEVYILNNNLDNIMKTNIKYQSIKSSILDIEIIKNEKQIIFLIFDILFYNQKDLRNDVLLLDRLSLLKNIDYENDIYKIKQKPYIDNFQIGVDLMLEKIDNEYKKDGLIFVPLNEPYPQTKKWRSLLKWKPQENNSIDFFVKQKEKTDKGIVYNLYINNPQNNKTKLELFTTELSEKLHDLINTDSIKNWDENKKTDEITWETVIYNTELDPDTKEIYLDETVIEFFWSFEENRFVPIKTRWDKLNNPAKWGNNISVAKDIWKSIKNPVKLNNIKTINNSLKNQNIFVNMRKYHNQIKNNLYKSITKSHPKPKIIELCSGRGGDVNKWMFNEVSSVLGFDVSKANIEECYKRLEKYDNKFQYKFVEQDLTTDTLMENLENIITEEYDSVVCHFGIHYMFKNQRSIQNFVEISEKYLKQDGLIVLTFVDSERLLNLKNKWAVENNNLLYYIDYNNIDKQCLWGNEISMYLNGDNILSTISNEYLVNIEMLKDVLKDDYLVLEQKNFSELSGFDNLDNYEKTISELYSYIVIKKTKKTQDDINVKILSKSNTTSTPEYFNEINYYLNDKAFKLFKITTKTDFEFVNNLYDYNPDKDLKFLEIEYSLDKLKIFKQTINDVISNHDDNKIILKIRFQESDAELFYLYTDNDYNTSLENKSEVISNISKLIDIMIGSLTNEIKSVESKESYPDLSTLKLEELKSMAKELKLPVSGKKMDLIERIKLKIEKKI